MACSESDRRCRDLGQDPGSVKSENLVGTFEDELTDYCCRRSVDSVEDPYLNCIFKVVFDSPTQIDK